MDFKQVVENRYSIRKFLPKEIPDDIVRDVIELAKLAPSAGNLQSYKVVITKEKVCHLEAPLNLIICADPEKSATRYGDRGRYLYTLQDATIFASYLQLTLVDEKLASCWVGAFSERRVRNTTKIPENLKPIAVICVGYPAIEKSGRRRRSYEEIIWKEE